MPVVTLNLAKRIAPKTTKSCNQRSKLSKIITYSHIKRTAGATPKATRSAKESNSTPNFEVEFVSLATRPSSPSQIKDKII